MNEQESDERFLITALKVRSRMLDVQERRRQLPLYADRKELVEDEALRSKQAAAALLFINYWRDGGPYSAPNHHALVLAHRRKLEGLPPL